MSKEERVDILISAKDYEDIERAIKELGYKSIEEFIEKALERHLKAL